MRCARPRRTVVVHVSSVSQVKSLSKQSMFCRADELTPPAMADPTSPKMVSHTGSFHAASEQTLLAPSEAPWRHDDVPLESTEQLQQPADFDVNEPRQRLLGRPTRRAGDAAHGRWGGAGVHRNLGL